MRGMLAPGTKVQVRRLRRIGKGDRRLDCVGVREKRGAGAVGLSLRMFKFNERIDLLL